MSILPQDLLAEILSRLPAKSLVKLKRVCKAWSILLKDPIFAKLQLSRSNIVSNDNSLLFLTPYSYGFLDFMRSNDEEVMHECSLNKLGYDAQAAYCNGLLCLCSGDDRSIVLLNPCTSESQNLPYPSPHVQVSNKHFIWNWGFGFHPETEEYKVVRFGYRFGIDHSSEVQVYTVGSGSWRKLENIHYCLSSGSSEAFCNGALHWRTGTEIWIMKDYGAKESWTKLLNLNRFFLGSRVVLKVFDNGAILLRSHSNKLDLYSPKYKTFTKSFESFDNCHFMNHALSVEKYVGNLVSPKLIENKIEEQEKGEASTNTRNKRNG